MAFTRAFLIFVAVAGSALLSDLAYAGLCHEWDEPREVGSLNSALLGETSGLSTSASFEGRLYHINDSNNETAFFTTALDGSRANEIILDGFTAVDSEEIKVGPCGERSCVYIGDIGDNESEREFVQLAWLEERATYAAHEQPLSQIRLVYPDGAHNAEAMVIHPGGDFYLFTKSTVAKGGKAVPSRVYRVGARDLHSAAKVLRMEFVGEIDIPELLKGEKAKNQAVTSASVSEDGRRLLLLTYKNVLEIAWDFQSALKPARQMKEGGDLNVIKLDLLPKQEGITFLGGSRSFLVSTESQDEDGAILQVSCRR